MAFPLFLHLSSLSLLAQEPTLLRGPYFGQPPPGDTPVLFAPEFFLYVGEYHAPVVFSPDGREAYWTPSMAGPAVTGRMSRMVDGAWTPPQDVDFGLEAGAREVAFAPDGERIYFISTQRAQGDPPTPDGRSAPERIWYASRDSGGFGPPRLMPPVINTRLTHWQFSLTADRDLYFTSWGDETRGGGDILVSRFVDGVYLEPEPLGPEINSDGREICPFVAPDESYLIFSRAPANVSLTDLFISYRRSDGSWSEAEPLPPPINSEFLDLYGVVSPDGKYFFFLSAREGKARIYWVDAEFIRRRAPR